MTAWRPSYVGALERWDTSAIVDALAGDVLIHVAVHDQPMRGNEIAEFLFGVLAEELGDVTVTDEILEADKAVVLFETSIGQQTAQGLNVVRLNEAGLIRELTVFFRPLTALTLIAEVVGRRMAERSGRPIARSWHRPRPRRPQLAANEHRTAQSDCSAAVPPQDEEE